MQDSKRDTDIKNRLLDSVGEGECGMIWKNSIETCILSLKHVYYMWNRLPVQVQCMRQGAQGWCTGITLRDGMKRKVGGEFKRGTHVHPWPIYGWQKLPQYCKVISFHLKKQNKKQTHVHRVSDAIQPSHPLLSPSPSAFNLSQH